MLVVTFDLRSEFPTMETIEAFIVLEAQRCGFEATVRDRWKYGLGCIIFILRKQQAIGASAT